MASSTRDADSHEDEIRLWREGDGWVARDVDTGVTTQGDSRDAALSNLDEAVALHRDEIGREPSPEELRDQGVDPADNDTGEQEPPDFMQ
jgi:predicted RNase H-like HicB family nuclease